jgi:hypothetical protein
MLSTERHIDNNNLLINRDNKIIDKIVHEFKEETNEAISIFARLAAMGLCSIIFFGLIFILIVLFIICLVFSAIFGFISMIFTAISSFIGMFIPSSNKKIHETNHMTV